MAQILSVNGIPPNPHRGASLLFCGSHPVPSSWLISPDTPRVVLGGRGSWQDHHPYSQLICHCAFAKFCFPCISSDHSLVCLLKAQRSWIKLRSAPDFLQKVLLGNLPTKAAWARSQIPVSISYLLILCLIIQLISSQFSSLTPAFLVLGQTPVSPEVSCQKSAHHCSSFLSLLLWDFCLIISGPGNSFPFLWNSYKISSQAPL